MQIVLVSPALAAVPRVAVVKSSSLAPFQMATTAMLEDLKNQPVQPEVLTFDLGGDTTNAAVVLLAVTAFAPDLIVTVGTLATEILLASPGDTPVLFTMVLYPEQSGFLRPSTHPVAGISLDIPLSLQFRFLRQLLPEAVRLGVLYSRRETGELIEVAKKVANDHGFRLEALEVSGPAEVSEAMNRLLATAQAIWSVADSKVFTAQTTRAIILVTLRQGVPLFGISAAQVRAGAVLALSADYSDIGRQSAESIARILGGESPRQLGIATPRTVTLTLNEKSARHVGLNLPEALKASASEIVQ